MSREEEQDELGRVAEGIREVAVQGRGTGGAAWGESLRAEVTATPGTCYPRWALQTQKGQTLPSDSVKTRLAIHCFPTACSGERSSRNCPDLGASDLPCNIRHPLFADQ